MNTLKKKFALNKKKTTRHPSLEAFYKKYTITDVVLGEGSFAVVKLGKNKKSNENVAIKLVEKEGMGEMEAKGVAREINILESLNHRNIVRLYDWYETDLQFILVMEYVGGGMLYDKIVSQASSFSEDDARNILQTLASALQHCQKRGIAHRDLKPQNILYNTEGTQLKLVDFNLSSKLTPEKIKELEMKTRCGTPHYVAPEVVSGKAYSSKCDIWSLGCILFVVASGGYQPFSSSELSSQSEIDEVLNQIEAGAWAFEPAHAWTKVSQECKDVITGMLQKDPEKRFTYEEILSHPWMGKNSLRLRSIDVQPLQKRLEKKIKNTMNVVGAAAVFGELMGSPDESIKDFSSKRMLGMSGLGLGGDL